MAGPKKIVVIGPESTGKSTLSQSLATELRAAWMPEHARAYLESIARDYEEADLLTIAKGQIAAEDDMLGKAVNYLICDTDLYVLKVWSEAKYGRCHRWILETVASRLYDLYLLCYIDVPWTADPLREHPAAKDRLYFYNQYCDIVLQSGVAWADIRGTESERLAKALDAIKTLKH